MISNAEWFAGRSLGVGGSVSAQGWAATVPLLRLLSHQGHPVVLEAPLALILLLHLSVTLTVLTGGQGVRVPSWS